MSRLLTIALIAFVSITACRNSLESKEKVQEAIVERLHSHSGLDLNSMTLTTTDVSFDKNKAYATVAFHPNGETALNSGMTMKYTLEARNGKWVVVNVADSQGHGLTGNNPASGDGMQLPPGHPMPAPAPGVKQ
ncbi:MAG TPA: hypothetical protein VGG97_11200 [Bryobacteraceae bacterium]